MMLDKPPSPLRFQFEGLTDMEQLFRLAAVIEILLLVVAGVYLYLGFRDVLPATLAKVTKPFALMFGFVAVSIIINYVAQFPPNPGVKALAIVGFPCTIWVWYYVVRAMKHLD